MKRLWRENWRSIVRETMLRGRRLEANLPYHIVIIVQYQAIMLVANWALPFCL
jgi:hypothetical protein